MVKKIELKADLGKAQSEIDKLKATITVLEEDIKVREEQLERQQTVAKEEADKYMTIINMTDAKLTEQTKIAGDMTNENSSLRARIRTLENQLVENIGSMQLIRIIFNRIISYAKRKENK